MIWNEDRLVKKRKEADPDQPKVPKSAYLLFCPEKWPRLAERYPSLGSREIVAILGKKWKKIAEEKKEKYKAMYL